MNHERTPCNMGVTVLAEIFTSGAKWAKKYRSELFLKNFSKISEILGKNRPKWQKSDFFDLDFSGTKNGRGNKFQEHLWWENVWIFRIFWNFEEILRRGHDTEIFHFSVFSGFHFSVRELPPNFFCFIIYVKFHIFSRSIFVKFVTGSSRKRWLMGYTK